MITLFFLDSGVGGFPYLKRTRELIHHITPNGHLGTLDDIRCIYMADRRNFPYGRKDRETMRTIIMERVQYTQERYNPQITILACNTASVTTLDDMRACFDMKFVGVVPAIKPAVDMTHTHHVAVLATTHTKNAKYVTDLIARFGEENTTELIAADDLVEIIEHTPFSPSKLESSPPFRRVVQVLQETNVDCVVLGCTHFIYVRDSLKRALGIKIIDSQEGVARQIIRLLTEYMANSPAHAAPSHHSSSRNSPSRSSSSSSSEAERDARNWHDVLLVTGGEPIGPQYHHAAHHFGFGTLHAVDCT